jgi:hypothetical protein
MKKHRARPRKPKIRHKNCDQGRAFDPTPGGMFHGGRAGLAPGSFLLPPRERGEHRTAGRIWASIVSVIMLITCSSAKTPCSHWPFANRQTGAETIAL